MFRSRIILKHYIKALFLYFEQSLNHFSKMAKSITVLPAVNANFFFFFSHIPANTYCSNCAGMCFEIPLATEKTLIRFPKYVYENTLKSFNLIIILSIIFFFDFSHIISIISIWILSSHILLQAEQSLPDYLEIEVVRKKC